MPDLFIAEKPTTPLTKDEKTLTKSGDQKENAAITGIDSIGNGVPFFTSLCKYPKGVHFQSQDPDEIIVIMVRRKFLTNIPWIIIALILSFLPSLIGQAQEAGVITTLPDGITLVLLGLYYSFVLGYILVQFASWFYNIGIVTNKKVVDIDYANLTYKSVAAANLEHVQDVEYTQSGFIRSFFDFGDIFIQTQGTYQNIEFHSVPKPAIIVKIILKLMEDKPNV